MESAAPQQPMQPMQPHPDIPLREVHEFGNRTYLIADVEPLDVTGLRTVTVGMVLFALAGLGLLPFHEWLAETDRIWWLWTCLAGFALGIFGFWHCSRRARYLRSRD